MIFLDTAFLYAYLVKEDVHHKEALKIAKRLEGEIFVTLDVIKELVTVVTYKISSEAAIQFFNFAKSNEFFRIIGGVEGLFGETMEVFERLERHKLSYVDCSLVAIAHMFDCEIVTFDKELQKVLE